jgi:hypothetical protein
MGIAAGFVRLFLDVTRDMSARLTFRGRKVNFVSRIRHATRMRHDAAGRNKPQATRMQEASAH